MNFNDQSRSCHPEHSEGSVRPSRQTLRSAQGDKLLPVLLVKNHYRPSPVGADFRPLLDAASTCMLLLNHETAITSSNSNELLCRVGAHAGLTRQEVAPFDAPAHLQAQSE